jgi:hypothetical protein
MGQPEGAAIILATFALLCGFAGKVFCLVNDEANEDGSRKDRKKIPDDQFSRFLMGGEQAALVFLFRFGFQSLGFFPQRFDAGFQAIGLGLQVGDTCLVGSLLGTNIFQRPLKILSQSGFRFVAPQHRAAAQDQFLLDVAHSPLNVSFLIIELSFVVDSIIHLVFDLRQAFFVQQQLHHRRIALGLLSHMLDFESELADLVGEVVDGAPQDLFVGFLDDLRFGLLFNRHLGLRLGNTRPLLPGRVLRLGDRTGYNGHHQQWDSE